MWRVALAALGGLGVALGVLALYSAAAVRQAEATYPPIGTFVQADGMRLHVLSRGQGPAVVLVHGSDGVLQDFTTTVFDAVAADYQAVAVDRPGHGYSARPAGEPLTLALNARLLHAALVALGIERPVLVGHSYGAAVALQYAADHPDAVAGLVLLAPAAYPRERPPATRVLLPAVPILGGVFLHTLLVPLEAWGAPAPAADVAAGRAPTPAYQVVARALGARPGQFAAYAEEMRRVDDDLRALVPRYGAVAVPVVIVAGAADAATPLAAQAEPLARALPAARLVVLPETGHWVHHAQPAAALAAIREVVGR